MSIPKDKMKPEMPDPEENGFIKTFNNMGYMTSHLDPFSEKFITYISASPDETALEIGTAYGIATIAALKAGAKNIIANDLDERHLQVLYDSLPDSDKKKISLMPGSFPEDLKIKDNSLHAILACRILHFFDGAQLLNALAQAYRWLKPGGKFFIIVESPYLKNWEKFIPQFEKRKADGDPWPGLIENVHELEPARGKDLPDKIHFFDTDTLQNVLLDAGFFIEECAYIKRDKFPLDIQLDGRESVGAIAVKK